MIYFIEGARNSGKSHISKEIASLPGFRYFQYSFTTWFTELKLRDNSKETHNFAMGKETMLLQLIKEGAIESNYLIDRGIFSVLSWGVMEGRVTKKVATAQLISLIDKGLLSNCHFLYIYGNNPNGERENKDRWDTEESKTRITEAKWMEYFLDLASDRGIKTSRIENNFDADVIERIKKLVR